MNAQEVSFYAQAEVLKKSGKYKEVKLLRNFVSELENFLI